MTANSASVSALAPLPFRLRTALGVLLAVAVVWGMAPRASAAYRVNRLVSKVADYGLCMAGPTGALAVAEDPSRFRALVRRRLLAASPEEAPFAPCAELAGAFEGGTAVQDAHRAKAAAYLEWGGGGSHNLNEIYRVLPVLEPMVHEGYPFVRKSLRELLVPTPGAREAVHPSDLPVPARVQGLRVSDAVVRSALDVGRGKILMLSNGREPWALRTRDQGRSWVATSAWQVAVERYVNRCASAPTGPRYGVLPVVGGGRAAITIEPGELEPSRREVLRPGENVAALSCDESGVTALVRNRARGERILSCDATRGDCSEIRLPADLAFPGTKLDIARIGRATVVAMTSGGVLRITTTRDSGASFTPPTLVFDAKDGAVPALNNGFVATLVPLGNALLLHLRPIGNGRIENSGVDGYALRSEDLGASFRSW
ncbi:MAG: hypothetical protein QM784_18365 [Polyangiaceae bacterium]